MGARTSKRLASGGQGGVGQAQRMGVESFRDRCDRGKETRQKKRQAEGEG